MPQPYQAPLPPREKRRPRSRQSTIPAGTRHNRPSAMSAQHVQPVSRYAGSKRNSEAMSAMTRCQSTTGSAAAATKTTGPERRADMRRSWRLPEHARKGGRDALDLAVGHVREERQRERAGGDVLTDRELARTVAERLAVVRHEVDRRQVRLALHPVLAQRAHDLVAVVAVRHLHDVDEPP